MISGMFDKRIRVRNGGLPMKNHIPTDATAAPWWSSPERLTTVLQTFYSQGTHPGSRSCLMTRCERILWPLTPALPPWESPRKPADVETPAKSCVNMKELIIGTLTLLLLSSTLRAAPPGTEPSAGNAAEVVVPSAGSVVHEIHYEGKVSDEEARFVAEVTAESANKEEAAQVLFEGELALL